MTECHRCGSKAHNGFLCAKCVEALRQVLADLPWFLDRLSETALGQTRMSDNGGRRSAPRKGLDGDADLAACIELLPNDDDLAKARKAREKSALAHALATGGVNARASELLAEIADSLQYWIRVMCEARGITAPQLAAGRTLGALRAKWLHRNVEAIALSEDADTIAGDIHGHLDDIVKVVNRPIRIWYLGECPTWDDKRDGPCGTDLRAPEGTVETYCPRCHATHNVNRLFLARVDEAERDRRTFDQLTAFNRKLPAEYQVPIRTLQHWRQSGSLRIRGHLDGEPLYSWADVKRLQTKRPQRIRTGAAAHRNAQ